MVEDEMVVTPWKVQGKIDYDKLITKFGTEPIDDELLQRIEKHTGFLHTQLRRRIFFSHRDLDWILDKYEAGERFVLYTGRGPSGPVHIGHLVPWIFTKHLQDTFKTHLYFQMTDDEKFLLNDELSLKDTERFSYENALDLIACGFEPSNTTIITDVKNIGRLYNLALRIAKHVNYSAIKAIFGFEDSSNIGIVFFPAVQAVPCFIASEEKGYNIPCLIPAAIDQDPYWRMTRDIASKLGYYKPSQMHCKFLPGLGRGGKMSASMPETCIFTTDSPEDVRHKVWNAFTGGKPTIREQKELGADPSICTIYAYFYYLFDDDDRSLMNLEEHCRSGGIMCGECKQKLTLQLNEFLEAHQKRREEARDKIAKFYMT